jgi:hypothetical protein
MYQQACLQPSQGFSASRLSSYLWEEIVLLISHFVNLVFYSFISPSRQA